MFKKVEIQSNSYLVGHYSEFCLIHSPQFVFYINVWTIGEVLTIFCINLIEETIRNLVLAKVLQVSYTNQEKTIRARRPSSREYYIISTVNEYAAFSWLECQILSSLKYNKPISFKSFVSTFIASCDKHRTGVLSRYILCQIAINSKAKIVKARVRKRFLLKELEISIDETISLDEYIKTQQEIGVEYLGNNEFRFFCEYVYTRLQKELRMVQHDD